MNADIPLLANLASTLFLTGLVWVLQVVQFPLMLRVEGPGFPDYVKQQRTRNTMLMAPSMLVEMGTGVWLLSDSRVHHPDALHAALLLVLIWIVTFASIVPLHTRLIRGYDEMLVRELIRRNWIRTLAWTLRSAVVLWMLLYPNAR